MKLLLSITSVISHSDNAKTPSFYWSCIVTFPPFNAAFLRLLNWTVLSSHASGVWLWSSHYLFTFIPAAPTVKAVCNAGGPVGTEHCDNVMSTVQSPWQDTSRVCHALCSLQWQCERFGMILTGCEQAPVLHLSIWGSHFTPVSSSASPWWVQLPVQVPTLYQIWTLSHAQCKN